MSYQKNPKIDLVLPKVQNLLKVGKSKDAFVLLSSILTNKSSVKVWSTDLETAISLYIDLSSQLHAKFSEMRHVFINYRASTTSTNQTSYFIKALRRLLESAEQKIGNTFAAIVDEEASNENETPEALSAYAFESEMEIRHREVQRANPAVRYLWETYRVIFEVSRTNNIKLHEFYHEISRKCFAECLKYNRKYEFKRFANILREQASLSTIGRETSPNAVLAVSLADDVSQQLETRYQQLVTATGLKLWAEAYNTIEDINSLLVSDYKNDASILLRIFEQLSVFFRENKNYLYYAYSVMKFFYIARLNEAEFLAIKEKHLADPEKSNDNGKYSLFNVDIADSSSVIVIASLTVNPDLDRLTSSTYSYSTSDINSRLLHLLAPVDTDSDYLSRAQLFEALLSELPKAHINVQQIYSALEVSLSPMSIKTSVLPLLTNVSNDVLYQPILATIYENIVIRLLQRLARVYTVVTMDRFISLAPPAMTWTQLESIIITAVVSQQVLVRIDHRERVLHFTRDTLDTPTVASKLATLASAIANIAVATIGDAEQYRDTVYDFARTNAAEDEAEARNHVRMLSERVESARRQAEEALRLKEQEKLEEEHRRAEELEAKRKEEQIAKEIENKRRIEAEKEAIQRRQMLEHINSVLKNLDGYLVNTKAAKQYTAIARDINNFTKEEIIQASREFEIAKTTGKSKRVDTEYKTLDYTVRALRQEQNKVVQATLGEKMAQEEAERQEKINLILTKAKADWEQRIAEKERLGRMEKYRQAFAQRISESQ